MSDPRTPHTADCVLIWYWSLVEAFPATVRTLPIPRENTSCPAVSVRSASTVKLVFWEIFMIVPVWLTSSSATSPTPVTMVQPGFTTSPSWMLVTSVVLSDITLKVPLLSS